MSRPLLRRVATLPIVLLAMLMVLLEATVWRWLTGLGHLLSRLAPFAVLERLVARLSPGAVAAVFVLPFLLFVPLLKFGELWLFLHGHLVLGVALLVAAKVVGVAFSARLFEIARPKLLQVAAFAWAYGRAQRLLAYGHALLDRVPGWVAGRELLHRLAAAGRRLLGPGQGGGLRWRLAAAMRIIRR